MTTLQRTSLVFFGILMAAAATNYVPGLTDEHGDAFGIFALDLFDDALHVASAVWALSAALMSHRASRIFLMLFGALYFADGLLGLATGSGFLDFGIFVNGVLDLSLGFRILANLPHLAIGGFAVFAARRWGQAS